MGFLFSSLKSVKLEPMKPKEILLAASRKPLMMLLFLAITGLIVYANILHAPFILDDHFMLQNPGVRDLPALLENWRENPRKFLTYLTFALNYAWGDENSFGFHLFNVLLHAFCAFAFWGVVRLLLQTPYLQNTSWEKNRDALALSAALIFLLHPLQTESVTYIWQRSEVLSGLFYLTAYLCYLKGRRARQNGFYLGAFLLFYVGLFAKGTVITLPVLILLTEYSFCNLSKTVKRRLIIGVLAALAVLMTLWSTAWIKDLLMKFGIDFMMPQPVPYIYTNYVLTQFMVLVKYVQLTWFPISQNFDYYFPLVNTSDFPWGWPLGLSLAALAGIFITALRLFSRHRLISFGMGWFFICLIPTASGITLIESIGEHRLYISLAGFAICLTALLWGCLHEKKKRVQASVAIILVLGFMTINRNHVWRSPEALFKDTIAKSPLHPRPHNALGEVYYKQGRLDEAKVLFERAIDLSWGWYPHSHYYLGLIHLDKTELDLAQAKFELVLTNSPRFLPAYHELGKVWALKKNYLRAEEVWQKSLTIAPSAEAYYYLAQIYSLKADIPKAEWYYEQSRFFKK